MEMFIDVMFFFLFIQHLLNSHAQNKKISQQITELFETTNQLKHIIMKSPPPGTYRIDFSCVRIEMEALDTDREADTITLTLFIDHKQCLKAGFVDAEGKITPKMNHLRSIVDNVIRSTHPRENIHLFKRLLFNLVEKWLHEQDVSWGDLPKLVISPLTIEVYPVPFSQLSESQKTLSHLKLVT